MREGNLEAAKRQPLGWRDEAFYDKNSLHSELERVFDICHGCRRCVNLCAAFPTLFDLVDESPTLEVDGVAKADYAKVVDQCYLCDLCAETKCPYLPPHEWAVDFPHLMLRAKAWRFKQKETRWRDRLITSTDLAFGALSKPGIAQTAKAAAASKPLRKLGERIAGIHRDAPLPAFAAKPLTKRLGAAVGEGLEAVPCERTTGKAAIFVTCYGNHNTPEIVQDLVAVLNHNGVPVRIIQDAKCCGMPKLELGDLDRVAALKDANLPPLLEAIDAGCDILAIVPSCVLMFKQELPLMFPEDEDVARVRSRFFDPFEYLMLRRKAGLANTDFKNPLGKVAYQVACHQRVQNIGMKTREFLGLIPGTEVAAIERCSGHDGTYAVKAETYDAAMKIARPVVNRTQQAQADRFGSDCPMAGRMIAHGLEAQGATIGGAPAEAEHPISMVRAAYGI